jgi:hypothetical protein
MGYFGIDHKKIGTAPQILKFENLSKEERDSALLKLSEYAALKGVI